jgi:hypothetical protein
MKCPSCGHSEAYMGFASIDCPNVVCKFYSEEEDDVIIAVPTFSGGPTGSTGPSGTAGIPAAPPGTTGIGIATNLRVDLTSSIMQNSVALSLVAHGDPGFSNKTIEILWSAPTVSPPRICTLSTRQVYHLSGINADGQTIYNTHWQCTLDGIKPTDNWSLITRIF